VDKVGRTIDFYLSERRDVNAAKHFFRKAMKSVGPPRVITLDAYAASHRAVGGLKSEGQSPRRVRVRSSQYLNNMIEQDHRRIKQRIGPMLGFKRFDSATVTISGIELVQKIKNISLRPAHWVAPQPQCRNYGTPCWPPDTPF
jgi:transposase-like protein